MKLKTSEVQTANDTNHFWFGDTYSKYHLTLAVYGTEPRPEAERILSRLIRLLNTGESLMVNLHALEEPADLPNSTHYHLVVRDEEGTLPDFDEFQKWIGREMGLLVDDGLEDKEKPNPVLTVRRLDQSDPIEGHPHVPRYMKAFAHKKEKYAFLRFDQGSFGMVERDQVRFGGTFILRGVAR